jgi:hypothetical protein
MTEEINNQERAKHLGRFWMGLAVGMVMLIGLITLSGCSNNGASNVNTSASTDKIYKVDELVGVALADKDAWKGKEVTVTGEFGSYSIMGGALGYEIRLKSPGDQYNKNNVYCKGIQGDDPKGMMGKTVEVKGKIEIVESGEYNNVNLKPCELKK